MRAALLMLLCACASYPLPPVVRDPAVRETLEVRPHAAGGALTEWEVEYDFQLLKEQGACRLRSPRVLLAVRQSSPAAPADGSPALLAGLDALAEHEEGHLRIDRAAAHALADALRSVPPLPDCDDVRAEARRAATKALEACKAENASYDAATNHGTR